MEHLRLLYAQLIAFVPLDEERPFETSLQICRMANPPSVQQIEKLLESFKTGLTKSFRPEHLQLLADNHYDDQRTILASNMTNLMEIGLPLGKARLLLTAAAKAMKKRRGALYTRRICNGMCGKAPVSLYLDFEMDREQHRLRSENGGIPVWNPPKLRIFGVYAIRLCHTKHAYNLISGNITFTWLRICDPKPISRAVTTSELLVMQLYDL